MFLVFCHMMICGDYAQSEALVFPTFFGPDNLPPLEALPWVARWSRRRCRELKNSLTIGDPVQSVKSAHGPGAARVVDDPIKRAELIDRGLPRVAGLTPENYVRKVFEVFDEIEPMRRCWGKSSIGT